MAGPSPRPPRVVSPSSPARGTTSKPSATGRPPDFERDSRTVGAAITDGNPAPRFDDIEDVIAYCAGQVRAVTGWEPYAIDLTQPDIGIPMSLILAPGLPLCDFSKYRS